MRGFRFVLHFSILLLLIGGAFGSASAQIPHLWNFQGTLSDSSGVALDGTFPIRFQLYDQATDGNLLYEEETTVDVVEGHVQIAGAAGAPVLRL